MPAPILLGLDHQQFQRFRRFHIPTLNSDPKEPLKKHTIHDFCQRISFV